ncbi:MAG TPA: L,D-transpeptidase family protein [Patescibacteria group bacterium]|nr:L,D-transpeptidase family protein [Patescibacteria group bacterium]
MRSASHFLTLLFVLVFSLPTTALASEIIDSDGDKLSDQEETMVYHTDPKISDTDGDGIADGEEVKNGFSPLHAYNQKLSDVDTDGDGLTDALEIALGANLVNIDTDGDNHPDAAEVFTGYNPLKGNRDRSVSRHVEVDLDKQQIHYFMNGVKLGSAPVSTGLRKWATPTGEFEIIRKRPVLHYRGADYNYPNTKWNLEFKRSFYIHGAYWHNQFGKRPMSHGCVNMAYKDVEKIYNFLDVGDKVKVYGKTPLRVVATK